MTPLSTPSPGIRPAGAPLANTPPASGDALSHACDCACDTPDPDLAALETASVPAGRVPSSASRGIPSQAKAICRALGEPVRVREMDDGDGRTPIVEPLRFIAVGDHGGGAWPDYSRPARQHKSLCRNGVNGRASVNGPEIAA